MGDANEGKRSIPGMEKLSLETNRLPRDLLQRFMTGSNQTQFTSNCKEEEEEEEIELNLGLSLGGRFGVDKSEKKKKLMRSSSIAGSIPIVRDDFDAAVAQPVAVPMLMRTASLPVETEEEWRKRKELQTLRRMEAKRRRSEKQRSLRSEKEGGGGGGLEVNLRGMREMGFVAAPPNWTSAGGGGGRQPTGSLESQGGSSSGLSESESRPVQGSGSCSESSPSSIRSLQERTNQEATGSSGTKVQETTNNSIPDLESPSKRPELLEKQGGLNSNSVDSMPCVFTQGDGPNGRRIDGILYKYGKGEEVRIMCVCHGRFLSPAEFVRHAGGTDVAHPLKHIVINPSAGNFFRLRNLKGSHMNRGSHQELNKNPS